jgi:hypothetical protein
VNYAFYTSYELNLAGWTTNFYRRVIGLQNAFFKDLASIRFAPMKHEAIAGSHRELAKSFI